MVHLIVDLLLNSLLVYEADVAILVVGYKVGLLNKEGAALEVGLLVHVTNPSVISVDRPSDDVDVVRLLFILNADHNHVAVVIDAADALNVVNVVFDLVLGFGRLSV